MVLNFTAFKYDYIGYQVSKIVNRTSVNENIDAEIKGLELETVWSPLDGLRLNMHVGYLDTEITGGTSIDTFNRTQRQSAPDAGQVQRRVQLRGLRPRRHDRAGHLNRDQ
jgi:outer membrane receptor protein involved in Fe transport